MRATQVAAAYVALSGPAFAYPGAGRLADVLGEIRARATINSTIKHEDDAISTGPILAASNMDSTEVIGDLATTAESSLTPVGRAIRNILTRAPDEAAESSDMYPSADAVPGKDSPACRADACCIWYHVGSDMYDLFTDQDGSCTRPAHAAVRLGFHDAAGWSRATGPLGGADGSIILAPEEMTRQGNRGLAEIVDQMKEWYEAYRPYGVGMADLIQYGAVVGALSCPQGPRTRAFIGRVDSYQPAPDGLLPPVTGSADFNIELMANKTVMPNGLAALLGAHTASQQRFVDPSRAGDPQDRTPGTWDTVYYRDTLRGGDDDEGGVLAFESDVVLARDQRTGPRFRDFARMRDEQRAWNAEYAREYVRLSMLGVNNINSLVECSRALPPASSQEQHGRSKKGPVEASA